MKHLTQKHQKELLQQILLQVDRSERNRLTYRITFFSCAAVGSIFALVQLTALLIETVSQTGFTTIASLAFSDAGLVLAHMNNYLFSLLETIPVMSLLFISTVFLVLYLSIRSALHDLQSFHKTVTI